MDTITLHLPDHIIHRLEEEAQRTGCQPTEVAEAILAGQLAPESATERDRAIRVLREAGMLSDLSDEMKALAKDLRQGLGSEEEIEFIRQELLSRRLEPPLSQTILEQRGQKL